MTPEATEALIAVAERAAPGALVAIVDPRGRAVALTPVGRARLGAADLADFERRFLSGNGPDARRLRHLAATLPTGQAPRLERLRWRGGPRASGW